MSTYGPPGDYGQGGYPPPGEGYPPPGGYQQPGEGYPPAGGYPPGEGYPPAGGYPGQPYSGDPYAQPASPAYPPPAAGYPQSGPPAYQQPVPPGFTPGYAPGPGMPPKKGSNTGLIITLSVLGVLLLLCCGGSIFVFAKAKDTVDSSIDAANSA
ncbi:MAG: hypothetical protein JXA67_18745, partial [Micromonosporaceae bacterium]|nr:hypothetical protein [Micromonosporaceae bacterium]